MRLSFKYRLYPNKEQQELLNRQLWACCQLYNAALEERRGAYKHGKSISLYDQTYQIKEIRAAGDTEIKSFGVAWNVLDRVDKAYQLFFKGIKAGRDTGLPRFHSSRRYDSLTYINSFRVFEQEQKIRLSGIGMIVFNLHRPIGGKVKTTTVKREAGRWYVIFSCEVNEQPLPKLDTEIGLDVGLLNYTMDHTGQRLEHQQFYIKAQRQLRLAQRRIARRKRGSNGRAKAVLELQRIHEKIKRQRADYQHKIARNLVKENQLIVVEDLSIKKMIKQSKINKTVPLTKGIYDAGWASLVEKISYKAQFTQREFIKVDPAYTNKCKCGGWLVRNLAARHYRCDTCAQISGVDQADILAAQEILYRGKQALSCKSV